ncbi:MAG: hypothetical protein IPO50_02235 [Sphingomonadales bacterium]|nr:hypothetical protein [Sphingomonadales bacterium]
MEKPKIERGDADAGFGQLGHLLAAGGLLIQPRVSGSGLAVLGRPQEEIVRGR